MPKDRKIAAAPFTRLAIGGAMFLGLICGSAAVGTAKAGASASGEITGKVVTKTGNPLATVCVSTATNPTSGTAKSASTGTYAITGLAVGTYKVRFDTFCSFTKNGTYYVRQYYNNVTGGTLTPTDALKVDVTTGATESGIDATMEVGGKITGKVVTPDGNPLATVCVRTTTSPYFYLRTDSTGTYHLEGLITGTYVIEFFTCEGASGVYALQYYNGTTGGTPTIKDYTTRPTIHVAEGTTVTGIDATMEVGGKITGKVVTPDGNPLATVCVEVGSGGNGLETNSTGIYTVTGIATGTQTVLFFTCSTTHRTEYLTEYYKGVLAKRSFTGTWLIHVTEGTTISGVNVTMTLNPTFKTSKKTTKKSTPPKSTPTKSTPTPPLTKISTTKGYWLASSNGSVVGYGTAKSFPAPKSGTFKSTVVGFAGLSSGKGYFEVTKDGIVKAFGAAHSFGKLGKNKLNSPIVGMWLTPTQKGYDLLSQNGTVFPFGKAKSYGEPKKGQLKGNAVALVVTTGGYSEITQKGNVVAFGKSKIKKGLTKADLGSTSVVAISATSTQGGYVIATRKGKIFPFGKERGTSTKPTTFPLVGIAVTPAKGYLLASSRGTVQAFNGATINSLTAKPQKSVVAFQVIGS